MFRNGATLRGMDERSPRAARWRVFFGQGLWFGRRLGDEMMRC